MKPTTATAATAAAGPRPAARVWRLLAGGPGLLAAPTRARRDRMYRAMYAVHGLPTAWGEHGPTMAELEAIVAARSSDPRSWDTLVVAYLSAYADTLADVADLDDVDRMALAYVDPWARELDGVTR